MYDSWEAFENDDGEVWESEGWIFFSSSPTLSLMINEHSNRFCEYWSELTFDDWEIKLDKDECAKFILNCENEEIDEQNVLYLVNSAMEGK